MGNRVDHLKNRNSIVYISNTNAVEEKFTNQNGKIHSFWILPFSTVSISQWESAIFVTNFRRWNAPLLISFIGLPDKLSLIKALVCFHDSDGISRIVFSDKSSSIKFVSLLKALGSTKKEKANRRYFYIFRIEIFFSQPLNAIIINHIYASFKKLVSYIFFNFCV